jgi:outer membrane protein OmpA-like peptidoglycan-associated protein
MRHTLLAMSIAAVLCSPAMAQQAPGETPPATDASIPVTYVGSNARVSLGVNEHGDVQGEALGIFGFDGDSAWLAQLWKGQASSGGVQVDYHWLLGSKTRQDTIDNPDSVRVAKVFGAWDQNVWKDNKATLGVGYQKNDFFVDGYVSASTSGSRFTGATTDVLSGTLNGTEAGHTYTQTQTITTVTDFFEHPYDHGIGVRVGQYFDDSLFRLRGGLDYERGRHGVGADQLTASVGIDKYFRNSGWSLSLEGEHLKKNGDFEIDKSDDRGWLLLRYEFGQSFRAREPYKMVQVDAPAPVIAKPAPPQVMRNEVKLDGDAFFNFDHSDLRADAVAALDGLLTQLKSNQRVSRITVTGHTDSIGTDAYNQALSERRAASAKAYLVQRGVPADQIDTRGDGERNPSFSNDTPANRQKNRRVDIDFLTIEETTTPAPTPEPAKTVEWKKEPVAAPAAWIERALRNPAEHKRTVDVYRFAKSSSTTALGTKQFANLGPHAVNDTVQLGSCPATIPVHVLSNDTDPENDTLTVISTGTPAHGTVSIGADGVVTYTPTPGSGGMAPTVCDPSYGGESFTYTISDSFGAHSTATVVILPPPTLNHPPVAQNDAATTAVATPVKVSVLGNDTDSDGDTLSITDVGTPAHGTAAKNADGTITYTPSAGYVGSDNFSYGISDGHGGTSTAQVTVTVSANDHAPVAVDDSATVLKGYGVDIDVLANDSDADGDMLRVISVDHSASPYSADVSINPDGTIRYQHHHGTTGLDSFTYTITDDHGHTATATVHVRSFELLGL